MPALEILSHWHHSVTNLSVSSLDFYNAIEATLRDKEAPAVRTSRVDWNESGVLSAKREYLRVRHARYAFDICAAPFGKDFFFSWWLTRRRADGALGIGCAMMIGVGLLFALFINWFGVVVGFLVFIGAVGAGLGMLANGRFAGADVVEDAFSALPLVGPLYNRFLRPITYFSEDSRLIFEDAVHAVIIEHVSALLAAKGARVLAPDETKPQSRRLLKA